MRFYKLPLQDLVVIHDELDLAAGKLRIKTGGGVAGHNGLRSIAEQLGSRDFRRVRIGIGHPGHKELVTGHVLGNFDAAGPAMAGAAARRAGERRTAARGRRRCRLHEQDRACCCVPRRRTREPDSQARIAGRSRPERLMGFNCGIVGLPNVGKSTLFNALVRTAAAAAANYPFCTIEPNLGRVPVPDERLDAVARIARSARIVPAQLEVVDIAGLVRGASRGEGLGNRFLAAIREVDAILQVLRCFEDEDVAHVEGGVDPLRDAELVETELLLADIGALERRVDGLTKRVRGGDAEARRQLALIEQIRPAMEAGTPARRLRLDAEQRATLQSLQLLTAKPLLYLCNVDEASAASGNAWSDRGRGLGHARRVRRLRGARGGDRGRDRSARRSRAGRVSGRSRARAAGPRSRDPGRLRACST